MLNDGLEREKALSTPVTTEHLNEWLREQIGEPVVIDSVAAALINGKREGLPMGTKLYDVKELK